MFNRTIVIDCSALCYSFAYTLDDLELDDLDVGIIYGFLRQVRVLAKQFMTNDIVFCWDSKRSIREEMFPEYKAKRKQKKKDDPEMAKIFASIIEQVVKLRERIIPFIGFKNSFMFDGFEADDLIARIVMDYEGCTMVSGDDDLLQLLGYADLWKPNKRVLITDREFEEEWRIKPHQWADVKCLAGCGTDEVPGIPGVKEKTAVKYMLGEIPKHHKIYSSITALKEETIKRNDPLVRLPLRGMPDIELAEHKKVMDSSPFWEICEEFQFKSFMKGTEKTKWEMFFQGNI